MGSPLLVRASEQRQNHVGGYNLAPHSSKDFGRGTCELNFVIVSNFYFMAWCFRKMPVRFIELCLHASGDGSAGEIGLCIPVRNPHESSQHRHSLEGAGWLRKGCLTGGGGLFQHTSDAVSHGVGPGRCYGSPVRQLFPWIRWGNLHHLL